MVVELGTTQRAPRGISPARGARQPGFRKAGEARARGAGRERSAPRGQLGVAATCQGCLCPAELGRSTDLAGSRARGGRNCESEMPAGFPELQVPRSEERPAYICRSKKRFHETQDASASRERSPQPPLRRALVGDWGHSHQDDDQEVGEGRDGEHAHGDGLDHVPAELRRKPKREFIFSRKPNSQGAKPPQLPQKQRPGPEHGSRAPTWGRNRSCPPPKTAPLPPAAAPAAASPSRGRAAAERSASAGPFSA